MSNMKQWVVGLTAIALLAVAGSVGAVEDEPKKDKKVEEGPAPKVEKDEAVVTPASWPCPPAYHAAPAYHHGCAPAPAMSYSYQCVTQYQTRARTVCEYVPVKSTIDAVEISYEEVKTPKTRKVTYLKEHREERPGKRVYYKAVTKKRTENVWVCRWVDDTVKQTTYECKPKAPREETYYTYECRPTQTKKTIQVESCEAVLTKQQRTACYTVNDIQAVTKLVPQLVQQPCPPDPCAPAQPPQVVCVPQTSYQCVPRTVLQSYSVDVVNYQRVTKPVDVVVHGFETVKKENKRMVTEYETVKVVKDVPVKVYKAVQEPRDVTYCDWEKVEEPIKETVISYKEETREEPYTEITYKEVRKPVKRECTTWQMQTRTICETVPVQVLVPVPTPCPTPAPAYYHHGHHGHHGGAVIPGPTCY